MTSHHQHLRELHQAATPGDWEADLDAEGNQVVCETIVGTVLTTCEHEAAETDAVLIAAMRNHLPALLDIAEAARDLYEAEDRPTFDEPIAEEAADRLIEALSRLEQP